MAEQKQNSNVFSSMYQATRRGFEVAGAAGRAIGNVIAPVLGGVAGGKIGGWLGKNIPNAVKWIAAYIAAQALLGILLTFLAAAIFMIFAAFAMFIINSGAYIVPPGRLTTGPGGQPFPVIDVGTSCPIPDGRVLEGSYGSPVGLLPYDHGENAYWDDLGEDCSEYPLGGCYAKQAGDYCYGRPGLNSCTTYGYAADFIYPNSQVAGQPVYLPYIEGESVNWSVSSGVADPQGRGVLNTTHNGTSYSMYVTHLEAVPVGGASGSVFGTLYGDTSMVPHLHVELRIDGVYVPPEYMCAAGASTGVVETVGCFAFTDTWPEELLEAEKEAAEIIMANEPYSNQLCAAGPISVSYEATQACEQGVCYGGERGAGRTLKIYAAGTGSVRNSLFTLAHESGHIYQDTTGADAGMLTNTAVRNELPIFQGNLVTGICTYPLDANAAAGLQVPFTENFAEAIALFISGTNPESSYRNLSCLGGTFRARYPNTWQYMVDNVFMNNGPW